MQEQENLLLGARGKSHPPLSLSTPLLADSHCHITDERLIGRAAEIVAGLPDAGLEFVIEASASVEESQTVLKFAMENPRVFCLVGVHPYCVDGYSDDFEEWVARHKGNKKIVGIGEVGLDYYVHSSHPRELQKQIFARQIELADKMGLPLAIHTRDAFDDTLEILVANKDKIKHGLLFHCFSEGPDQVAQVREHFDAYFAFGGAVTYKNKQKSTEAVLAVGLDRILVETDAPYLSPEPLRGSVNEPKNVRIIAEHLAKILAVPFSEFAAVTLENTKRLFRIKI